MTLESINEEYKKSYAEKADFDYSAIRPYIPVVVFNLSPLSLKCSIEQYEELCEKAKSDESEYSYEELSLIINAYGSLTYSMCDLGLNRSYKETVDVFLDTAKVWNEKMEPMIERRNKLLKIYSEKLTHNGNEKKGIRKV